MTTRATKTKAQAKSKGTPDRERSGLLRPSSSSYAPSYTSNQQLGAFYSAGPAIGLASPVQAKFTIGQANDPYEREADSVADSIVNGGEVPSITPVPAAGLGSVAKLEQDEAEEEQNSPLTQLAQRSEEEESDEPTSTQPCLIQRQAAEEEVEEESSVQTCLVQREAVKEDEQEDAIPQTKLIQRQAMEEDAEETVPQTMLIQREAIEEGEQEYTVPQTKLIQRQATEAETEEQEEAALQTKLIQRQDEGEEEAEEAVQSLSIQRQDDNEEEPVQMLTVQRQSDEVEEEPELQAKMNPQVRREEQTPSQEGASNSSDNFDKSVEQMQGGGAPLPDDVRDSMGEKMGADFSGVGVHTGGDATDLNRQINARAFTTGNDIFFNSGEYAPASPKGQRILAHELTHVVQQQGGASRKIMKTNGSSSAGGPTGGTIYSVTTGAYSGTEIDTANHRIIIPQLSLPAFKSRNRSRFPMPLTIRRGRRPTTQQIGNWRTATNNQATSQVQQLARQARNRGGVNQDGQVFFQARQRPEFLLFGSEEELVPRFEIPIWDSNKVGRTFQVDHIREMQLGGHDASENYELLDATANMSAGWRLGNPQDGGQIGTRIRAALRALRQAHQGANGIPAPRDWQSVRYGYEVTFNSYDFSLSVNGDGDKFWSLSDIQSGRHSRLLRPMREREIERLGQQGTLRFFASSQGGESMPLPRQIPMQNWIPRVDLKDWSPNSQASASGDISGTLTIDAFRSASGRQRAAGVSVPPDYQDQQWTVRMIDGIYGGYIDRQTVARGVRQSLRLPGMSPIEMEMIDLTVEGIRGEGRVLPTVPLIRGADIRIRINGDNVELYKTFSASEINVPSPFELSNTELTVFFGTGRGLGIEGRVDFGIQSIGTGYLGAAASMEGGFALEGEFDFDGRLFGEGTSAQVRVGYREDQWSMGGTLTIPEGKVPGVRTATINVDYAEGAGFSAEGAAELDVPGVESGTLAITHSETEGFMIGGSFGLSPDTPGIRGGTISAEVRERPDGEGYSVSASGEAQPDIPGINSNLLISYNDGAFTAEVEADYTRGMLSGRLNAGVTNRSVGEDGQLSETAEPSNPLIVYGGGSLTIEIAPWLQGTAGVEFAPDGEITVTGEIGIPNDLEIFPRQEIDKSIFSIAVQAPIVPGIVAEIGGGLGATAGIGPGVIDELRLGITYNPAHEEDTTITGDAHLTVPADAGLRLSVRAGIGLGITGASATGGLEIGGTLGIEGAAEAGVHIEWSPASGLDLNADVSVHAQPAFKFDISGYVSVQALGFSVYDETWELASFQFGSDYRFGIRLPVHYHEGEPFNISLDDVEFEVPDIDTDELLQSLISRIT